MSSNLNKNVNSGEVLLSCEAISKVFKQGKSEYKALEDINLAIESGKSYCVVGESGSGKSTLLQILGTVEKPTKGSLFYNSEDLFSLTDSKLAKFRLQNIGFIYQYHHLLVDFSALENIMLPQIVMGVSKNHAKDKAMTLLSSLGILDKSDNRPSELSGGQKQRVAIARALANNPKVIIADEPTGNLDSKNSELAISQLLEICKVNNSSLVIATHNREITQLTDRVISIIDGKINNDI